MTKLEVLFKSGGELGRVKINWPRDTKVAEHLAAHHHFLTKISLTLGIVKLHFFIVLAVTSGWPNNFIMQGNLRVSKIDTRHQFKKNMRTFSHECALDL